MNFGELIEKKIEKLNWKKKLPFKSENQILDNEENALYNKWKIDHAVLQLATEKYFSVWFAFLLWFVLLHGYLLWVEQRQWHQQQKVDFLEQREKHTISCRYGGRVYANLPLFYLNPLIYTFVSCFKMISLKNDNKILDMYISRF